MILHGLAFVLLPSGGGVKTKNPPPSGGGFWLKFSSRIKTRRPRSSAAARSQAAGSDCDSCQVDYTSAIGGVKFRAKMVVNLRFGARALARFNADLQGHIEAA
jgi:hypothetical protein